MDSAYLIGLDNEDGSQRQIMVVQEVTGSKAGGIELLNNFKLNEGIEERGIITFNDDFTEWTYEGDLNPEDEREIAGALQRRYRNDRQSDY